MSMFKLFNQKEFSVIDRVNFNRDKYFNDKHKQLLSPKLRVYYYTLSLSGQILQRC